MEKKTGLPKWMKWLLAVLTVLLTLSAALVTFLNLQLFDAQRRGMLPTMGGYYYCPVETDILLPDYPAGSMLLIRKKADIANIYKPGNIFVLDGRTAGIQEQTLQGRYLIIEMSANSNANLGGRTLAKDTPLSFNQSAIVGEVIEGIPNLGAVYCATLGVGGFLYFVLPLLLLEVLLIILMVQTAAKQRKKHLLAQAEANSNTDEQSVLPSEGVPAAEPVPIRDIEGDPYATIFDVKLYDEQAAQSEVQPLELSTLELSSFEGEAVQNESAESVDSVEPVELIDLVKSVEPVERINLVEPIEPAKPIEPAESAEAVEPLPEVEMLPISAVDFTYTEENEDYDKDDSSEASEDMEKRLRNKKPWGRLPVDETLFEKSSRLDLFAELPSPTDSDAGKPAFPLEASLPETPSEETSEGLDEASEFTGVVLMDLTDSAPPSEGEPEEVQVAVSEEADTAKQRDGENTGDTMDSFEMNLPDSAENQDTLLDDYSQEQNLTDLQSVPETAGVQWKIPAFGEADVSLTLAQSDTDGDAAEENAFNLTFLAGQSTPEENDSMGDTREFLPISPAWAEAEPTLFRSDVVEPDVPSAWQGAVEPLVDFEPEYLYGAEADSLEEFKESLSSNEEPLDEAFSFPPEQSFQTEPEQVMPEPTLPEPELLEPEIFESAASEQAVPEQAESEWAVPEQAESEWVSPKPTQPAPEEPVTLDENFDLDSAFEELRMEISHFERITRASDAYRQSGDPLAEYLSTEEEPSSPEPEAVLEINPNLELEVELEAQLNAYLEAESIADLRAEPETKPSAEPEFSEEVHPVEPAPKSPEELSAEEARRERRRKHPALHRWTGVYRPYGYWAGETLPTGEVMRLHRQDYHDQLFRPSFITVVGEEPEDPADAENLYHNRNQTDDPELPVLPLTDEEELETE